MTDLSPLPLDDWLPTRDRLQRWAKLMGAVRRQRSPARKHWWHIALLPAARGLTTGPFDGGAGTAELHLDLVEGALVLATDGDAGARIALAQDPARRGREALRTALAAMGVEVDLPSFPDETAGAYDASAARDYLRVLGAVGDALRVLQAELPGETSPIQLWPHGFDVAMSWLSGRTVPGTEQATDAEQRDETVTVGFSTGDAADPEPYLYAIAYPWHATATGAALPLGRWRERGWNGAFLSWAAAVETGDAAAAALGFWRGAWRALAAAQGAVTQPAP